jgi:arylsulfatase A-like enzyme
MGRRAGVLVCALSVGAAQPALAARPPDIVLIVTDDQRVDTLPWMPIVQRRLVRRGVTFTNAMVPTPTCCPSRSSILTGLFAHSTGVWSNGWTTGVGRTGGWVSFHRGRMERRSVAVWLQETGYRTVLVGKYLNGYGERPRGYVPPGWDRWHAFAGSHAEYYDYDLIHSSGRTAHFGRAGRDYSTDVLRRYALHEIRRAPARQPLFLMFAPLAPHHPSIPAPRDVGSGSGLPPYRAPSLDERDLSDKPGWVRSIERQSTGDVEVDRQGTFESLQAVDDAIGAIMRAVRHRHGSRRTMVIFTSDNGLMWGEHQLVGKFVPYSHAARVPLVIRWTGRLKPGVRRGGLALNVDLAPTIADAAGIPTPQTEGRSLLEPLRRRGFVIEATGTSGHDGGGQMTPRPAYCGWRTRRFLFVSYGGHGKELYDYRRDPWELHNVASKPAYQPVVERLRHRSMDACVPKPPGFRWGGRRGRHEGRPPSRSIARLRSTDGHGSRQPW